MPLLQANIYVFLLARSIYVFLLARSRCTGLAQWQSTRLVSGRSVVQTRDSALVCAINFR